MEARKTVWIFNHYAALMVKSGGGRHYSLASELSRRGYDVVVFSADTIHNSSDCIEVEGDYSSRQIGDVTYVFLRCRPYVGNGLARILNMGDYYRGVKRCAASFPRPDVILGSSVHPLAQVAAMQLAKKYSCGFIAETRDLWPASLEEYGMIKAGGLIAKLMYWNELRCYKAADAIIFTMEGGADYIVDKGWDVSHGGPIDLAKVYHINNGVDLEAFRHNESTCVSPIELLAEGNGKTKIVYAGSVRKANDIGFLVDTANCLRDRRDIEFVVIGNGDQLEELRTRADKMGLRNICFAGAVEKREIPSSLKNASLLLLYSCSQTGLSRYGMSQNKLFDYLASGKPILSNLPSNYSIINKYDCGVERSFDDPHEFATQIEAMLADKEGMKRWGRNSAETAELYSFACHADHLAEIIEKATKEEK